MMQDLIQRCLEDTDSTIKLHGCKVSLATFCLIHFKKFCMKTADLLSQCTYSMLFYPASFPPLPPPPPPLLPVCHFRCIWIVSSKGKG